MRRLIYLVGLLGIGLLPSMSWAQHSDIVQCAESEKRILCNLSIYDFIERVSPILTNGWENTLQIDIALLNSAGDKVIQRSRLEATQRCYLDPFASPCLILWRGAPTWQRYRDENAFLKAMSHFGIQALTLTDLPADNYKIRIHIQLTASAQKRLESIRSWFKQSGSDSGNGVFGNGSFIGSFLSSRAEAIEDDVYEIELETTQFYIDLNFVAPELPPDGMP
jgi:hypothetical protein